MKQCFDEMFNNYTETDGNGWGINWRSSHYRRMKDAISIMRPVLQKQQLQVLEVGCATGDMTELILNCITDLKIYDALDISEKAISICKKKNLDKRCRWFVGYIANLQMDETYNIIICCDVIYYLPAYQQKKCMNDFYNILNHQGRLFFCVPYDKKEVERIIKYKGNFIIESERTEHLWLWCKIESGLFKCYKMVRSTKIRGIIRGIIENHVAMEFFTWINRNIISNKHSHMFILLKKE
ncbi:class I SAM-dependent methyltransferase [Clostridiaceae bacterium]|nr:class I SAM-dependent methyltransferase [Clostridiaceae bacterium]RKI16915.1 class I SAM-dependent methyltransferase [bacterium 1XD21-70]